MTLAKLIVVAAALLGLAATARAQSVEAEVLFREGKRLMKAGQTAAACDKFDASARVESSTGTLLNAADCRERNGQLATAWGVFLRAASAAKIARDPKREAEARRRASALEKRLSSLTITVAEADRAGLVVRRNQVVVDPALWNQPVPVDGGDHEIVAEAPGRAPWSTKVTIAPEGGKAAVEVEIGAPVASPALPAAAPPPVPSAAPLPEPARPAPEARAAQPSFTSLRKASVVVAILGVGGVTAGAIFGAKSSSLKDQANQLCPAAACADAGAVQKTKEAQRDALKANIGFIAGGAAIAAGVTLWILGAPSSQESDRALSLAPNVGGDQVGLLLAGRF